MTHDEIAFLLNNGYTVEEIMQLENAGDTGGAGESGDNEQQPAPEQTEAAGELAEKPGPEAPAESSKEIQGLQAEVAALKAAMQKQNILTISTPSIPGADDSTEKILAEFIRPPLANTDSNNGGK